MIPSSLQLCSFLVHQPVFLPLGLVNLSCRACTANPVCALTSQNILSPDPLFFILHRQCQTWLLDSPSRPWLPRWPNLQMLHFAEIQYPSTFAFYTFFSCIYVHSSVLHKAAPLYIFNPSMGFPMKKFTF